MSEQPAANESQGPKPRSTQKSLASVVLGFELVIVFLGGLSIFGLNAIEPRELGIVLGVAIAGFMIVALALMRTKVGIPLGWATQFAMLATGFILPALFVVGGLFFALWIYCMTTGSRMDRE